MTVASTTARLEYTGDGNTDTYSYTFKIFNKNDIEVIQVTNDSPPVESILTVDTDYTVSDVGEESGGSITLTAGDLTSGYTLIIRRKADLKQESSFRNQGSFFPENHENQFDKLVMQNQQQQDELDRSIKCPPSVTSGDFDPEFPTGIVGAQGKAPITNATGDGWATASEWPTADEISNAQTYANNASSSATAAAASATAAQAAADSVMWQDVNFVDNGDSPITITESSDRSELYVVDASSGNVSITIPEISGLTLSSPFSLGFKRSDSTANTVTINCSGSDTFNDGSTSKTIDAAGSGFVLVPDTDPSPDEWTALEFGSASGAAGDDSWTMTDLGSGQIKFNAGSRIVNGIVETIASDITTNATVVAITDDTLTTVDASNGFLYEASDTIRIWTFYDIVDEEFKAIGNSTDDTKFDYRLDANNQAFIDAGINLARHVPIGYVDVTASGSPGTVSVSITNFPVQAWTTFNNVAAAESWQDWTPTLTNGNNASATYAKYRRIGNSVQVKFLIEWSGAGSGGNFELTVPITPSQTGFATGGTARIVRNGGTIETGQVSYSSSLSGIIISSTSEDGILDGADFQSGDSIECESAWFEIDEADGYNPIAVAYPNVDDLIQTNILSSDITSNGVMADLTTTVEIGKTYEVNVGAEIGADAGDNVLIEIYDGTAAGGTLKGVLKAGNAAASGISTYSVGKSVTFTATSTTMEFKANSISGSSAIRGNGTTEETYVQVKEIPSVGTGVLLPEQKWRELVLGSNVTSTGDVSALSLPSLPAGKTFDIEVNMDCDYGDGDAALVLEIFDGTSGGGTSIMRVGGQDEQGSGSAGDETAVYGVSKKRRWTMSNTGLTASVTFMPTSGVILGGGLDNRTYLTVKEVSQNRETTEWDS